MSLSNPDARRALRSAVEAFVALCLVALLFWIVSLLSGVPAGLEAIARGCLIIIGLNALFYGAENVTRAIKLTGPLGTSAQFGGDDPSPPAAAAQAVANSAQETADQIKEVTNA